MFGMTGEESLESRTRITDAVLKGTKENSAVYEYHVLKELASPKISYLPFSQTSLAFLDGHMTRKE